MLAPSSGATYWLYICNTGVSAAQTRSTQFGTTFSIEPFLISYFASNSRLCFITHPVGSDPASWRLLSTAIITGAIIRKRSEIAELNPNNIETQRLDHAVRTGIISAALIGVSIGILFGLTHSAQVGAALVHAIGIYGDSSLISFDPGSPMIASIVSIIPAVIGGIAGAGAPIGASTLARWLSLNVVMQLLVGLVIAIVGGGAAGAIITAIIPQFAAEGAALGAGVGTVTGIVALSSYQLQGNIGNNA